MNEYIAGDLISSVVIFLKTPKTKEQKNSQLEIIKKFIDFEWAKMWLKHNFRNYVWSLNIPLFEYVVKELDIKINDLCDFNAMVDMKNKKYISKVFQGGFICFLFFWF